MTTWEGAFVGAPPKVTVVERMLLSQVPENERTAFLQAYSSKVNYTRSGEPVFPVKLYEQWKQHSK
jgi:hypothetical protein